MTREIVCDSCERDYQHADECLAPDEDSISRVLTIHDYAFLRNRIARAIASERHLWQRHKDRAPLLQT